MKTNKKILLTISIGVLMGGSLMAQTSDQQDKVKASRIESNSQAYRDQGGQLEPVRTLKAKDANVNKFGHVAGPGSENDAKRENSIVIFPNDATYPKYVNTGNKVSDDANYLKAKNLWIDNNPMKYEKLTIKEKTSEAPSVIRARELKSNIHENSKK